MYNTVSGITYGAFLTELSGFTGSPANIFISGTISDAAFIL